MFCSNCGNQISEKDKFCPECGTKIEIAKAAPVIEEAPVTEEPFIEAPVVDEPVIEAPVVDEPVIEEPVIVPVVEEQIPQAPVQPVYQAPAAPVQPVNAPAPAPEKKKSSGLAIAGLICGGIAMILAVTCCGSFLALGPAVAGIVLSAIGIAKSRIKVLAIIALILSIAALILSCIDIYVLASMDVNSFEEGIEEFGERFSDYYDVY